MLAESCQGDVNCKKSDIVPMIVGARLPATVHVLASPGQLRRVRLPTGHGVRVDTYAYSGWNVPAQYDPIVAKVITWGHDRAESVRRMQRALNETEMLDGEEVVPGVRCRLGDVLP